MSNVISFKKPWSSQEDTSLFNFLKEKANLLENLGDVLPHVGGYQIWTEMEKNGFSRTAGACRTRYYHLKKTNHKKWTDVLVKK